ncbi:hypothetical protein F5B20DRAFT_550643 [Whalleya microplaca]|nr:hypothetical protein F5B20DRAFT_550643 [Whalleya microplaca]
MFVLCLIASAPHTLMVTLPIHIPSTDLYPYAAYPPTPLCVYIYIYIYIIKVSSTNSSFALHKAMHSLYEDFATRVC